MELSYMELREQMCDVCHKMWQLGWVAANDGNLSAKLPDGTFLATPTGISKSFITPEKLVRIDAEGNVLEGLEGFRPSSEIKMHLRCYKERDDVGAVLHAHLHGAAPAVDGRADTDNGVIPNKSAFCHNQSSCVSFMHPQACAGGGKAGAAVPVQPYVRAAPPKSGPQGACVRDATPL